MTARPRVLVVDDDPSARMIIGAMLGRQYEFRTAGDGNQVFELLADFLPDVIVSDVVMPNLGGVELAQILKSDVRYSHIPLVLITAHDNDDALVACLDAGADDYLSKPLSPHEFRARIRAAVRISQTNRRLRDTVDELVLTKDQLRAILDSAADAIISYTGEGLIRSWNRAAAVLFGLELDGVGEPHIHDLGLPKAAWVAPPDDQDGGALYRLPDQKRTLEVRVGCVGQGDVKVAVIRDVTSRLGIESEVAAARRHLIQAFRHDGQNSSAMDLRDYVVDVLSGVQIYAGLFQDSLNASRRRRLARFADQLQHHRAELQLAMGPQGERIVQYAQALADDFAREKVALSTQLEGLSSRVQSACDVAISNAPTSRALPTGLVDVRRLLDTAVKLAGNPDVVRCSFLAPPGAIALDEDTVLEILVNLLRNAVHASSARRHPKVQVLVEQADERAFRLSVADNGDAIEPQAIQELLEHGYSDHVGSRGLGLQRCHELARGVGGRLTLADASPDASTRFLLELPPRRVSGTHGASAAIH